MLRSLLTLAIATMLFTEASAQTKKAAKPASDGWGAPAPAANPTAAPVSDNKNAPDAGAGTPPADAPAPADAGFSGAAGGRNDERRMAEGVYAAPGAPVIMQSGRISSLDNGAHARARERAAAKANRPVVAPTEPTAPGTTVSSGAEGTAPGTTGAATPPATGTTGAAATGGTNTGAGATGAAATGTTKKVTKPAATSGGSGWGEPAPAVKKAKTKTKAASSSGW